MAFDKVYEVDPEFSEQAFKRRALIDLAMVSSSPDPLKKIMFGPVRKTGMEALAYSCDVDLDYSYDLPRTEAAPAEEALEEQEPEQDSETEDKPNGEKAEGHASGSAYSCVFNWGHLEEFETNWDEGFYYITHYIPSVKGMKAKDVTEDYAGMEPYGPAVQDAQQQCAGQVFKPVEGARNVSVKRSCSNVKADCYFLPCYQTTFSYENENYDAIGYACGSPYVWTNAPLRQKSFFGEKAVEKGAEKAARIMFTHYFFLGATVLTLLVAFIVSLFNAYYGLFFIMPLCVFLLGLGMYKYACVRYDSYLANFDTVWKPTMVRALNREFEKRHYNALTEKEIARFSYAGTERRANPRVHNMKDLKDLYLIFCILFVAYLAVYIVNMFIFLL